MAVPVAGFGHPVKADPERAHLGDLCRAARSGRTRFTRFLEPPLLAEAARCARAEGVGVSFWGGFEGAERCIAAFYASAAPENWPIACLRADWSAAYALVTHRDRLGAALGRGVERSLLGDILVGGDHAYIFTLEAAAPLLLREMTSAGRARIALREAAGEDLPTEQGVPVRDTVMSMRLDAVAAAGFSMGRAEAQEMIRRGLVKLNHLPEERADARVCAGDLISVRGRGRLRVDEAQGPTKKGRLGVRMTRFGAG
jgi:RNA-binding protein YlmH